MSTRKPEEAGDQLWWPQYASMVLKRALKTVKMSFLRIFSPLEGFYELLGGNRALPGVFSDGGKFVEAGLGSVVHEYTCIAISRPIEAERAGIAQTEAFQWVSMNLQATANDFQAFLLFGGSLWKPG